MRTLHLPDFDKIKTIEELTKSLFNVFLELNERLTDIEITAIDKNAVFSFARTKEETVPNGFIRCNGTNGSFDLSSYENAGIIYAQKKV